MSQSGNGDVEEGVGSGTSASDPVPGNMDAPTPTQTESDKKKENKDNIGITNTSEKNGGDTTSDSKPEKKKKKRGTKLTHDSAFSLEQQVQMSLIQHQLARKHLGSREFWLFTVPQAVLTLLASILAFVATSELINEKAKVIISTIVGSISGVVVFLQTMNGVCNYGTRAAMHDSTAIDLRDLRDDLVLLKHKLSHVLNSDGKREYHEHEEEEDDDDDDPSKGETFEAIQTRFRQSLTGCKSTVPVALSEAFQGLDSELMVAFSFENKRMLYGIYKQMDFDTIIYFKACDILMEEISTSGYFPISFPIHLPDSKKVVSATMEHLKDKIFQVEGIWKPKSADEKTPLLQHEDNMNAGSQQAKHKSSLVEE